MKTKIFFYVLFFSLFAVEAFAQMPLDTTKEKIKETDIFNKTRWQFGLNINTVEPITEAGFDYIAGGITRIFNPTDLSTAKDKSSSFGFTIAKA